MSINRVILMGRLCKEPELKQTQSGVAVCSFDIAINRQYADKQTGERQADFVTVQAWRTTAEFVAKYFGKGSMIIVEGSLRNNNYTDKNGVKHYSMIVQADSVNFGESKSSQQGNNNNTYQQQPYAQPQYQQTAPQQPQANLSDFEVLSDGDVPF